MLLLPFLPYILSGLAVLTGLAANAWLGFTDWQTAAVFSAALVACVYVAQTNSPLSRLGVTAIVGVALYLKGGIDADTRLSAVHEAEKSAIHAGYAISTEKERQRQAEVNDKALADAAASKERADAELASLRKQIEKLAGEAKSDVRADELSLSGDAVKRLNTLRMRRGS